MREARRRGAEVMPRAFAALADEVGAPKHGQVLGHGRLGDPERLCQIADGALAKPDALEQLAPCRVDEGVKNDTISHDEYKYMTIE